MKSLDTSTVLLSFEGKPIPNGKEKDGTEIPMTLKDVLLSYLSQGQAMGLNAMEMGRAYKLGMLIGGSTKVVTLQQPDYDLLKKLCDDGNLRQGQEMMPRFSLVISQQAKELIDAAETVKGQA